jgi:capsular exopolysaccharide synthesis family protein
VVASASPPISASFPKIPLTLAVALGLGLAIGCGLAVFVDYLDSRIKSRGQVETSGLLNIAAVPEISARELASLGKRGRAELKQYDPRKNRLLPPGLQPPLLRYAIVDPISQFAEEIRSIRFVLQHAARGRSIRVISITSAVSGEGKTTIAANLAQSLAILGLKVVLVDGDLRSPQLSRALCPSARSGVLEVALSELPLSQALLFDPITRLAVLPTSLLKDVTLLTEFASSDGMSSILAELREQFDVVIVDSPPLLPVVDGRALAELSDAVIMTASWNRTPVSILHRAVELLEPVRDRVLGVALTRVNFGRLKLYESDDSAAYSTSYPYGTPAKESAL